LSILTYGALKRRIPVSKVVGICLASRRRQRHIRNVLLHYKLEDGQSQIRKIISVCHIPSSEHYRF